MIRLLFTVEGGSLVLDALRLVHDIYVASEYWKAERERAKRENERIANLERRLAELERGR